LVARLKRKIGIRSKRVFLVFLLPLLLSFSFSSVAANYNIKVGDAFKFKITLLDAPYQYLQVGPLIFSEGTVMKVVITSVDMPYIEYSITINGAIKEFSILSNILVQNRSWDKLSAEYRALGYNIYEDKDLWGVRLNGSTFLHVDYLKQDGVLYYFHARNESSLKDVLKIDEIVLVRTWDNHHLYWPYAFFALLPLGGIVYGFIRYYKKIATLEKKG